jgi:phage tail sheath protein FI
MCDVDATQALALQRSGVNAFVRTQPGVATLQGNVSFAALTSTESCWRTLSVARLTSFILRSIERYTRWVFTAERSNELAWDLERQVWIFLARLQQREALVGRTPEQGFFVRTETPRADSGEPPSGVAITLRVGFASERPNEFVIYDFRFRETTMTTEVVPVASAERRLG